MTKSVFSITWEETEDDPVVDMDISHKYIEGKWTKEDLPVLLLSLETAIELAREKFPFYLEIPDYTAEQLAEEAAEYTRTITRNAKH